MAAYEIARVEEQHRDRYRKLLDMVEAGTVFKREKPIRWRCLKCGYECFPRHLRERVARPPFVCPDCGEELYYDEEE